MLYPARGPSSGKNPVKSSNPQSRVYRTIGEQGMVVFKKFITENNNKGLREIYFSHPFIRRLWPTLLPHMTVDLVFKTGLPAKKPAASCRPSTSSTTRCFRETSPCLPGTKRCSRSISTACWTHPPHLLWLVRTIATKYDGEFNTQNQH